MADQLLKQRVEKVLDDLSRHTGHGGIFHSLSQAGRPTLGRGVCRFCSRCVLHSGTGDFCHNSACTAAVQGHAIGDIWYFRCWLGFDSLAIAIAPEGEIVGCIEVGGFFSPGGTEEAQQTILSRLNTLARDSLRALPVGALQGVRELNFKHVKAIADFLSEATFAGGLNVPAQFRTRQRIYAQRQRLARRIQELGRDQEPAHSALLRGLNPLIQCLRTGNSNRVLSELDNFLGTILLHSDGQLPKAKAGLLLLMAAMFRENIEMGDSWHKSMRYFEERVVDLEKTDSVEDAFIWVEELVRKSRTAVDQGGRTRKVQDSLSDKVLAWLGANYASRVTLAEAAAAVAASPSNITHRLKIETGKTFVQHLAALRVSEAKRLLAYTSLSLSEIATRCGFSDQSYFTKVFRREVNMTPGYFRSVLDETDLPTTTDR